MNSTLQKFARDKIKADLLALPGCNQVIFKRMYSHLNLDADIGDVVDSMPAEKLDWAMQQVERTMLKLT